MKNKITKSLVFALASSSVLGLSGCSYLDRHEGITTHAGDSLAANEANMVVDPWPDQFDDTDIPGSGERLSRAVDRYQKGGSKKKTKKPKQEN